MHPLSDKQLRGSSLIGLRLAPPQSQLASSTTAKRQHTSNAYKLNKKSRSINKPSTIKRKPIVPVMIDLSGVGTNQKKSDRQKERKHPSVNMETSDKENITSSSCYSIKMNFDISKNDGSAVMPKQFSGAMPESFPKSTVRTPHIMSYGEGQLRTLV